MPNKYVLWRVSNGWLMTQDTTIWDHWDKRQFYAVFHNLREFSDYIERGPKPGEPLHHNPPTPQPPTPRKKRKPPTTRTKQL